MMIIHRTANQAGSADYGWLQAKYTFSFGHYFDPKFLHYGPLRALNQEVLAPGAAFQPKSYPAVDIINLVLRGKNAIRDNDGLYLENGADECQFFAPRQGVSYTESNPCNRAALTRIQLWLRAAPGSVRGESQSLSLTDAPVQLLATHGGENGSIALQQDIRISHLKIQAGDRLTLPLSGGQVFYQSICGEAVVCDGQTHHVIACGDGAFIQESHELTLRAETDCRALLIEMPD